MKFLQQLENKNGMTAFQNIKDFVAALSLTEWRASLFSIHSVPGKSHVEVADNLQVYM